ncbi:MAG TPA: helicase-associated domain-containing protein [Steroidobacteraceae bacterium]
MPAPENNDPEIRVTDRAAQANLRIVLELCAAGRLRCSATTRRPSAATQNLIAEHLTGGDFYPGTDLAIQTFAWPLLLQAGGLATLDGTKLLLTPKGRAAQTKPGHQALADLWRRWLTRGLIDEFSRVDAIKGQRGANVVSAVKTRRSEVGEALHLCEPGDWLPVDDLFALMRQNGLDPAVHRSERALWRLYLQEPEYGSLGYDGYHPWSLLQGRYTLAVLFEYTATLGLIDVSYIDPVGARDDYSMLWGAEGTDTISRYDGLTAVRLNPLGAFVSGMAKRYEPGPDGDLVPTPEESLTVLDNGDIVATATISADDELALTAIAQRTGDRLWTVTTASLLAALDAGRTPADITTFLRQRTVHALPAILTAMIDDVARRSTLLIDGAQRWLISSADPALIALITHDRHLRALCEAVGDHHLAVLPGAETKFRAALRGLGYLVPAK